MKPSNSLIHLNSDKRTLAEKIFNSLMAIQGVISVTFVGSFYDRQSVSEISDIDVIVVCEKLTRPLFENCNNSIQNLSGMELGFPDKLVYINSSFGPLKFDTSDQIVIHLMVYDRDGHRRHVLDSPFTCLDWERSPVYVGYHLNEIYPVLTLQPRDFANARRGIEDYINDLEGGKLSYRVYEFDEFDMPSEIKKFILLDSRHSGEYAYHIIRNLISNYAKLLFQQNMILGQEEFYDFWNNYLPQTRHIIPHFQEWEHTKHKRGMEFPGNVIAQTKEFLFLFSDTLLNQWTTQARRVFFVRHAKTGLNDGSFLGQGRDPDIIESEIKPLDEYFDFVYSSPMQRAIQTANIINPNKVEARIDNRLSEQDYGEAEGLNIQQLQDKFPEVIQGWAESKDICFPGGENTSDVEKRLFSFLTDISMENNGFPKLVVTHNVVLRCLIGNLLGLGRKDWYKLKLGHVESFELILSKINSPKSVYLNLTKPQKAAIIDNLIYSSIKPSNAKRDDEQHE